MRGALSGCADCWVSMGYFVSRVVRLVALVMLVFALACSELPELTTLMDNSSNDFTVVASSSPDVAAVAAQVTATVCVSPPTLRPTFVAAPQHVSCVRGSCDILALYSLLRT
jgi:hypothetical protein